MKKYILLILFAVVIAFSMDDITFPYRPTTATTISLSQYLANLDSIVNKSTRNKDTVQNLFVRKQYIRDTTWDSVKTRLGKIDTVTGDSAYHRVIKSRLGRVDTIKSDSGNIRVIKSNRLTIDTLVFGGGLYDIDTGTFQCTLKGITSTVYHTKVANAKYQRINEIVTISFDSTLYDTIYPAASPSYVKIFTNIPTALLPTYGGYAQSPIMLESIKSGESYPQYLAQVLLYSDKTMQFLLFDDNYKANTHWGFKITDPYIGSGRSSFTYHIK